jgi:purine-nucleoside phosphorylase
MLEAINETTSFIRSQTRLQPEIAIILGTGLGKIADEIEAEKVIPYEKIPNLPVSTV